MYRQKLKKKREQNSRAVFIICIWPIIWALRALCKINFFTSYCTCEVFISTDHVWFKSRRSFGKAKYFLLDAKSVYFGATYKPKKNKSWFHFVLDIQTWGKLRKRMTFSSLAHWSSTTVNLVCQHVDDFLLRSGFKNFFNSFYIKVVLLKARKPVWG